MILVGIILFLIGALLICASSNADLKALVGTILVAAGGMSFVLGDRPTAMDVYQGKTTLKVTYKNGVPVDSVVVFKDKEK